MKEKRDESGQWAELAGLRFVLALLVVITHSEFVAPGSTLYLWLGHTGYPAVFGFFMISGYSIAASITARPNGYIVRRFKRIYPAYLFALAFSCLVFINGPIHLAHGAIASAPDLETVVGNLFMLQGTLVHVPESNGPLWSLSIEWWCYMLAAVLIHFRNRVSLGLMLLSFAGMLLYYRQMGFATGSNFALGWNTALMAWAWLSGFVYYRDQSRLNFMLMLLLPIAMLDIYLPLQFGGAVIAVSAVALVLSKGSTAPGEKATRYLIFLGNASYPLYLLHEPVMYALGAFTAIRHGATLIATTVAAVLVGYYIAVRALKALTSAASSYTLSRQPDRVQESPSQ